MQPYRQLKYYIIYLCVEVIYVRILICRLDGVRLIDWIYATLVNKTRSVKRDIVYDTSK